MQFLFLNVNEILIGILNEAQACKVDEAKYTASFSFEECADFSFDDVYYVGFNDIDGNLVFYEVRDIERSNANGIVSIEAEHAAFVELLEEVCEGKAVQGATAGYAAGRILEGSRWRIKAADTTPIMSTTFYYKNKWECFETIASATNCAFYFGWTITGNVVTDRHVTVKARQGAARGKRFDLSKNMTSIQVVEDRSSVYTKLYGRGKGEEIGTSTSGQTTYGRRLDFSEVEWSTAAGDPMDKPLGQKYLEDANATQSHGRGASTAKRAREAIVIFDDCEDAEELLQRTYEKLLMVRYPKLTITGKVVDLERVWGYQHEAVRLGDDVLVIADEWNATYQDKVVGLVRDYLNPFNTEITIGEEGSTSYSLASKLSSDLEAVKEKADIGSALAVANPDLLRGILDTMATQIISSGTGIATDPNDGSLILTANDGNSAVKLTGSGILISNEKSAGAWVWKTALNGDGVATGTLTSGVVNAAIIKILGTDQFYWDASNIYIQNPDNTDQQIRIGLYNGTNYGIGYTTDAGETWQNAIGFDGVHFSAESVVETVIDSEQFKNQMRGKADQQALTDLSDQAIVSVDVEFYLSTSNITLSGGEWSSAAPAWENGKYMWQRTLITYGDGTQNTPVPTCIAGAKGNDGTNGTDGSDGIDGRGIDHITEQYYKSLSATALVGGSWMETAPTWENGKYIWTRSAIYYTDAVNPVFTNAICTTGATGNNGTDGKDGINGKDGVDGKDGTNGKDGTSVTILGSYDTYDDLVAAHPTGTTGDSYIVDGDLYVWSAETNQWKNVGTIQGPAGTDGKDGADGINGADGTNGVDGVDGKDGADGVSVTSITPYYKTGESATTAPDTPSTTSWSVVAPAVAYGHYLWCSYLVRFSNNSFSFTTPFMLNGADQLTQASTEPTNPVDGMVWLDTSEKPYQLKRYDGEASSWEIVSDFSGDITSIYSYVDTSVSTVQQKTSEISAYVEQQTVAKSVYDTFTETVRNILSMEADGTTMIFQRISEAISSVDNKQQTNYNEILKYIRFVDGNIILGEQGNEITLTIKNNRLSFQQNGNEIAYMSDNQLVIANAEIKAGGRLRLGVFGFVPRADGSLSFLKVGEGN